MTPTVTPDEADILADEVLAVATKQAALDAALLDQLRQRAAETGPQFLKDGEEMSEEDFDALATEAEATFPYVAPNRAERRKMVEQFKANLRSLPRAQPVRNPTIRPRKH